MEDIRTYCIYVITNLTNKKRYVGYTFDPSRRWKQHQSFTKSQNETRHLYNSMRYYGIAAFEFTVIIKGLTLEAARAEESRLITEWETKNPKFGYNMTDGGDGAQNLREESVEKIRLSRTGKKATKETREKQSTIAKEKQEFFNSIPVEEIVSLDSEGKSLSEIAKKFRVSVLLVRSKLKEAGISVESGGGPKIRRANRLRAEGKEHLIVTDDVEISRLYLSGSNTVELGKMWYLTPGSVGDRLKRQGVQLRRVGKKKKIDRIEKICADCGILKLLDQYNKHTHSSDGHSCYCRDCERKQQRHKHLLKKQKREAIAAKIADYLTVEAFEEYDSSKGLMPVLAESYLCEP